MTIKDISLKWGILAERAKAIVYMRHFYWTQVFPEIGVIGHELSKRADEYVSEVLGVQEYGLDLEEMANQE